MWLLDHIFLLSGAEMQHITIDLPFYTTIMINVQKMLDSTSEAISTYILALELNLWCNSEVQRIVQFIRALDKSNLYYIASVNSIILLLMEIRS